MILKSILSITVLASMIACSAQNQTEVSQQQKGGKQKAPPSMEEAFEMFDENKDGKLAYNEVKGPLQNDFAQIDTDQDGFISKAELKNAPKPERGNGGPPPRQ